MVQKTIFLVAFIFARPVFAQQIIRGQIFEIIDSKEVTLPGATLFWVNSQQVTSSDLEGNFSMQKVPYY